MKPVSKAAASVAALIMVLGTGCTQGGPARATPTPSTVPSSTPEPQATVTTSAASTAMPSSTPRSKLLLPTNQAVVEATPDIEALGVAPYPNAPLCADTGAAHDNSLFHTLWDSVRGCHYDHEHGQNPFTPVIAATFPDFDLPGLIGGVGVGHTNPSSPMENTHKHGGFKWDVTLAHSAGCAGREGVDTGVDALVVQYHAFGDYSIEFEARTHSAVALMRQCQAGNPTDYGYVFVIQLQDYGQRVAPYQGGILPYPDTPLPAYDLAREPYFSVDCFGGLPPCDKYPTLDFALSRHANADSTWISEPVNLAGSGSHLFGLLFRVRDTYQMLDWNDQTYPFTFAWLCSTDNGVTYSLLRGCRYNNSTTRIHELIGEVPADWDNLAGFDTDPRPGRVTAEGFVTRFGDRNSNCTAPELDCHPLKLVQAFTGRYGSQFLISAASQAFDSTNLPERDIYFCGEQVCMEADPGAVASGWIGPTN